MYFVPIVVMVTAYSIITMRLIKRKVPGSLASASSSAQDRKKRKVTKNKKQTNKQTNKQPIT